MVDNIFNRFKQPTLQHAANSSTLIKPDFPGAIPAQLEVQAQQQQQQVERPVHDAVMVGGGGKAQVGEDLIAKLAHDQHGPIGQCLCDKGITTTIQLLQLDVSIVQQMSAALPLEHQLTFLSIYQHLVVTQVKIETKTHCADVLPAGDTKPKKPTTEVAGAGALLDALVVPTGSRDPLLLKIGSLQPGADVYVRNLSRPKSHDMVKLPIDTTKVGTDGKLSVILSDEWMAKLNIKPGAVLELRQRDKDGTFSDGDRFRLNQHLPVGNVADLTSLQIVGDVTIRPRFVAFPDVDRVYLQPQHLQVSLRQNYAKEDVIRFEVKPVNEDGLGLLGRFTEPFAKIHVTNLSKKASSLFETGEGEVDSNGAMKVTNNLNPDKDIQVRGALGDAIVMKVFDEANKTRILTLSAGHCDPVVALDPKVGLDAPIALSVCQLAANTKGFSGDRAATPGSVVTLVNIRTQESVTTIADKNGSFAVPMLGIVKDDQFQITVENPFYALADQRTRQGDYSNEHGEVQASIRIALGGDGKASVVALEGQTVPPDLGAVKTVESSDRFARRDFKAALVDLTMSTQRTGRTPQEALFGYVGSSGTVTTLSASFGFDKSYPGGVDQSTIAATWNADKNRLEISFQPNVVGGLEMANTKDPNESIRSYPSVMVNEEIGARLVGELGKPGGTVNVALVDDSGKVLQDLTWTQSSSNPNRRPDYTTQPVWGVKQHLAERSVSGTLVTSFEALRHDEKSGVGPSGRKPKLLKVDYWPAARQEEIMKPLLAGWKDIEKALGSRLDVLTFAALDEAAVCPSLSPDLKFLAKQASLNGEVLCNGKGDNGLVSVITRDWKAQDTSGKTRTLIAIPHDMVPDGERTGCSLERIGYYELSPVMKDDTYSYYPAPNSYDLAISSGANKINSFRTKFGEYDFVGRS